MTLEQHSALGCREHCNGIVVRIFMARIADRDIRITFLHFFDEIKLQTLLRSRIFGNAMKECEVYSPVSQEIVNLIYIGKALSSG